MTTKTIWMYWHQGWAEAPPIATQSLASWSRWNPGYDIRALDQRSLPDYTDLPQRIDLGRRDLTVQKIAALARLALLAEHGGVWTDATVVCARPLDDWLGAYFTDCGFFAFRNPG